MLLGIAPAAIAQVRNAAFGAVQIITLVSNLSLYEVDKLVSTHLAAEGSHHVCRFKLFST